MNNIHDGIMPTMLSIETPFNSCVYIEDVNRGPKKMSNDNAMDATLIISEFLKWTRLQNHPWVATIMDQAIKVSKKVFQKIGS